MTQVHAAVQRRVQRADPGVGVLLVRAEGLADVLDLSVVSLSGLLLSELPGLRLNSRHKTSFEL